MTFLAWLLIYLSGWGLLFAGEPDSDTRWVSLYRWCTFHGSAVLSACFIASVWRICNWMVEVDEQRKKQ